jgi:transposase InsO family protein/predicted aspartyl protease
VPVFLDNVTFVQALVDSGCDCYSAIDEALVDRMGLPTIPIPERQLRQATGHGPTALLTHMTIFNYDLDGWKSRAVAYVVPNLHRDLILGSPWLRREEVVVNAKEGYLTIGRAGGLAIKEISKRKKVPLRYVKTGGTIQKGRGGDYIALLTTIQAMTTVLQDTAQREDETTHLPEELQDFQDLFSGEAATRLPPHRGRMDHHIRLQAEPDGRQPDLPWGPLYSMPRDQLIELRRQVTELMDKGWIRASSSSAGAPVLLVKKPNGTWRLCVDYRGLNKITKADRYPLPLIRETLRTLGTAKYFTKVDVRSAFHRIRVAKGDEPLTAFRTRFGLFEWLVCPMGLSGAPSTFQRYINSALKETLGIYSTAYLDDVLIYSNGSKKDHTRKVRRVLGLLRDAGLHLDIRKCKFMVKEVLYLGYVVTAGKSVKPDPEKVKAIQEWERPTSQKAVRSFLGFANFYRDFVPQFSRIAAPLHALTKRNADFQWTAEQQAAFNTLKAAFISSPALVQWDPDRPTVVEADCSGGALGGCLSQEIKGVIHPVAYHSASLTTEQRNYTIHDKELLAVVKCIEAWSAELLSTKEPFTVLTDHKNLEYFSGVRLLSERQQRWAELLSKFRYQLQFRPGRFAGRPDALSRRDQDTQGYQKQPARVMTPIRIATIGNNDGETAARPPVGSLLFTDRHMQLLWDEALRVSPEYLIRWEAVLRGERRFPAEAMTVQQIADCTVSAHGTLMWRGVMWLPSWEPLTTAVIQRAHEAPTAGHPGRNQTFAMLRREYHWDGMAADCARYVRNCHCYGAHASRLKRQGLLQPLPIPDRFWSQISMDFMVNLPQEDEGAPRYLLVITDRLSKYIQLEAMTTMTAEACAERFRDTWWRFHGFPSSLITDRGSDWLGNFWTELCRLVGIEQLLSTAHHPQTDGGTERANQEVQAVLRLMVNFTQTNWPACLPACQLALNNRDSSVTGMSPNLLLNGYTISAIQAPVGTTRSRTNPKGRAVLFAEHLRDGMMLTQAAIAYAQQRQQDATNRSRRPAEKFRVGDKVWFSMRNVKTVRASRKLDWLQAKYTVTATPTPLTVTLDLPGSMHKTVHVDLVERAADDPLSSQILTDSRPGPAVELEDVDESLQEWEVEAILQEKNARGRGKKQVLVKWKGWLKPSWHPKEDFLDTEALQTFEAAGA